MGEIWFGPAGTADSFSADVMAESLRRSGLGALQSGAPVNLERAMPADGRFGGHIVSGHIDGTGTVASLRREDNAVCWPCTPPLPCCGTSSKRAQSRSTASA